MDTVVVISHFALTISSSLSFYIYFVLYGAKHKVIVIVIVIVKSNSNSIIAYHNFLY